MPAISKNKSKPKSQKPVLAFPVTRSKSAVSSNSRNKNTASPSKRRNDSAAGEDNKDMVSSSTEASDNENKASGDSESEEDEIKTQQYHKLGFRQLKDLKMAVTNY